MSEEEQTLSKTVMDFLYRLQGIVNTLNEYFLKSKMIFHNNQVPK